MRLANGDRAGLGTKLEDYVLNPRHREGRPQGTAFRIGAWYYASEYRSLASGDTFGGREFGGR